MVSPDKQFQCHGKILAWRFEGKKSNPFRAIVWRPLNDTVYNTLFKIVGINEIPPNVNNFPVTYTVPDTERITVEPGDMIGWSFGGSVLTYNGGGGYRVRWLGGNLHSTLETNQVHDIRTGVQQREYSIEATVGQPCNFDFKCFNFCMRSTQT